MGATPDGVVYDGAFGKANVEHRRADARRHGLLAALDDQGLHRDCRMQLIEQGRMHLDRRRGEEPAGARRAARCSKASPPEATPRLRPAKRPITVRHLLTHTSGYTYSIWSDAITRYEQATGMPDIATCQNAAFTAPLEFEPGERWQYGISMDWVGKLVEQVTDQSLEVYFRENIFAPLGMKDSGFLIGSAQKRRLATFASRQPTAASSPRRSKCRSGPNSSWAAAAPSARRATISPSCRCC